MFARRSRIKQTTRNILALLGAVLMIASFVWMQLDAETGIRQEIDNGAARPNIQVVRSSCSRSWPWRTRLRCDVWQRP